MKAKNNCKKGTIKAKKVCVRSKFWLIVGGRGNNISVGVGGGGMVFGPILYIDPCRSRVQEVSNETSGTGRKLCLSSLFYFWPMRSPAITSSARRL